MQLSIRRLRRGGAVVALAGTGGLVALGSAGAFVGGGAGGGPPKTNAPDLISATITRAVEPTAGAGPTVRFCFDSPIATVTAASFAIRDYDVQGSNTRQTNATTAVVDPSDPTCVIATYPNGVDAEQDSYGRVDVGGAVGNGNVPAPFESAPLTPLAGSTYGLKSEAGHTTGPELVSAAVTGQKEITYTFDEKIDPTPGAPYSAANFGYYINSANGGAPTTGTGAVVVNGNTAIIQFATAITSAVQYAVAGGAVQDVDPVFNGVNDKSTIGNAGTQITGSPGLDGATKNSDNQSVNLHFTQGVNPGVAAQIFAYREDGTPIAASSVTTTNDSNNQTLKATFPVSLQKDPGEVVRVAVAPLGATARSGPNNVTTGAAAIGTCKCTYGYTNGPDLLNATIDDAGNTATFFFDEPINDTPAPTPANFGLLQPDGTSITGLDSVVVSADKKSVQVHFGSSVSATVGVQLARNTVFDQGPELNGNPTASVDLSTPTGCQAGSCNGGTATPSPSVTAGPTAGPTAAPGSSTKAKLKSVKVKRGKVKGKVSALAPCAAGRKVKVKKGSKTLGSGTSKSSGSFSIKLKHHKKGHLKVTVSKSVVGTVTCKSASKKVSGKH